MTGPPPRRPCARWRDQRQRSLALDVDGGDRASASAGHARAGGKNRRPTPPEIYERTHAQHPEYYDQLVSLARDLLGRGVRYSARGLWEHLRVSAILRCDRCTEREEPYRLNDHAIAHYAREIMRREPDLAGYWRTRRLRT